MKLFMSTLLQAWASLCREIYNKIVRRCDADKVPISEVDTSHVPVQEPYTVRSAIIVHQFQGRQYSLLQSTIFDSTETDPITTLTEIPVPWTPQKMSMLVLDEFDKLHAYCRDRQVVGDVYIGYKRVREAIKPVATSFPSVRLLDRLERREKAYTFREASLYRPTNATKQPSSQANANAAVVRAPEPRLVVATDGSAAINRHRGIGWACIAADGRHAFGNSQKGSNPTLAELNAIELALKTFQGPLDIHTDCRPAIDWIASPEKACNHQCTLCAKRISRMLNETQSNIVWVKGHSGHPLNEAADRLARIARLDLQGMYAGSAKAVAERVAREQTSTPILATF